MIEKRSRAQRSRCRGSLPVVKSLLPVRAVPAVPPPRAGYGAGSAVPI